MERLTLKQVINFCFLSLLSLNTLAAIGTITEHSKDPASILRDKDKLSGIKGTEIQMNDTVNTNKSIVGITFDDDTKVNITENSKLVIDDFVYEPKKGAGKLGLKVALGTVRYASGVIAHTNPNAVNIQTPTATIAVRGTDFLMSVDEIGRSTIILLPQCEKKQDEMICFSGIIDVSTAGGIVTLDKPNQATVVDSNNAAPSTPVVVNMEGRQLNNTIQLSPPQTSSGIPVTQVSRGTPPQPSVVSSVESSVQVASQSNDNVDDFKKEIVNLVVIDQILNDVTKPIRISKVTSSSDDSKLQPYLEKQVQTGWQYKGISDNHTHYTNILMPLSTDIKLTVIQDLTTDSYVMGSGEGGSITIRQFIK